MEVITSVKLIIQIFLVQSTSGKPIIQVTQSNSNNKPKQQQQQQYNNEEFDDDFEDLDDF